MTANKPFVKDGLKSGWSIVYIEGYRLKSKKNIVCLSLGIDFVLANSAGPDKVPTYNASLYCISSGSRPPD